MYDRVFLTCPLFALCTGRAFTGTVFKKFFIFFSVTNHTYTIYGVLDEIKIYKFLIILSLMMCIFHFHSLEQNMLFT